MMMMMMMMMMMRLLDGGQMPKADPAMKTSQYVRDRSQNHLLGIFDEELQQVREEEDEDQAAHGIFRERKKKSKRNNPTLAFEKKKSRKRRPGRRRFGERSADLRHQLPVVQRALRDQHEGHQWVTAPPFRFCFVLFCFSFFSFAFWASEKKYRTK